LIIWKTPHPGPLPLYKGRGKRKGEGMIGAGADYGKERCTEKWMEYPIWRRD
jgi:hypothetical protein